MASVNEEPAADGIHSLLDTDLYKLTMQCGVLRNFPDVRVSYLFTNRTPHMRINRAAFKWLQEQITRLGDIRVSSEEIAWLKKTCPYFSESYLKYLETFRLQPAEQVDLQFVPAAGRSRNDDSEFGNLKLQTHGLWVETILYEIPLLALVSEAYFKFVDKDWNHRGQRLKAQHKGEQLLEAGCAFSEFGSRRRRDYRTHELVMEGLLEAQKKATSQGWKGKFSGTSNVHFAMRFGVNPVGTVAHEWYMGIAALTQDYAHANETALKYWIATYGPGVLGVALTDTFGTPTFLRDFALPAAPEVHASDRGVVTYAQIFTGVRQDSGDPLAFVRMMKSFYATQDLSEPKTIIFSDSLNVDKCIQYKKVTEDAGLVPSFGVGTFFTNDFWRLTKSEKSVPMNIVIKLSEAKGVPAVKLSDNRGKNMGPEELVGKVKEQVGYTEKDWEEGDEAHRWDDERGTKS